MYLISYKFIIQYVYKFKCYSLESWNGFEFWTTCFELLYLFTPRCIYCRLVQVSMFTLGSVLIQHRVPNGSPCAFISGKVCLLGSIKFRRKTLPEINAQGLLFGTLEYPCYVNNYYIAYKRLFLSQESF